MSDVKKGDKWFLISQLWWNTWCSYVDYAAVPEEDKQYLRHPLSSPVSKEKDNDDDDTPPPPPPKKIDNSSLLASRQTPRKDNIVFLKFNITPDFHYTIVPPQAWILLKRWYGGGKAIERRIDEMKRRNGEVYLSLRLYPEVRSPSEKSEYSERIKLSEKRELFFKNFTPNEDERVDGDSRSFI